MPRRKQPAERLERLKQHQTRLNRLISDVRLSPNRALLAQMLSMYFDVVKSEDQEMMKGLLISVFGNPRQIKWLDNDDPPSEETHLSRRDAAATEQMRNIFSDILSREGGSSATGN